MGRFIVDIVRGDLLIEIQTRNFAAIKDKLTVLTKEHPVRLVYPIAQEKWIIKPAKDRRRRRSRRKSPKRGAFEHLFEELVRFPLLLLSPNLSLEVLLIQEEEHRRHDPSRAWRRRGWVTHSRHLVRVVDRRLFETPADIGSLLPSGLVEPFTTADLAAAIAQSRRLAQRMAYCLRRMGLIVAAGKQGNTILYRRKLKGEGP